MALAKTTSTFALSNSHHIHLRCVERLKIKQSQSISNSMRMDVIAYKWEHIVYAGSLATVPHVMKWNLPLSAAEWKSSEKEYTRCSSSPEMRDAMPIHIPYIYTIINCRRHIEHRSIVLSTFYYILQSTHRMRGCEQRCWMLVLVASGI